jgi:hypothetical protein
MELINYKKTGFAKRIEASLASISSKPGDKFKLVRAYYEIGEFDCELCGKKHCCYCFEVQNLETNIIIKVGSECIHHFKDKGVNIDLAEGLMDRVMKASLKARKELKDKLGKEAWDKLSEEERKAIPWHQRNLKIKELSDAAYKAMDNDVKRELVTREYLILQAKELLVNVSYNKSILSEEEIENLANLGLEAEMERAMTHGAEMKARQEAAAKLQKEREDMEAKVAPMVQQFLAQVNALDFVTAEASLAAMKTAFPTKNFYQEFSALETKKFEVRRAEAAKKFSWLTDYTGANETVLDIKKYFNRYGEISARQEEFAKKLISNENAPKVEKPKADYSWLTGYAGENPIVINIKEFFNDKGFISAKQDKYARRLISYEK